MIALDQAVSAVEYEASVIPLLPDPAEILVVEFLRVTAPERAFRARFSMSSAVRMRANIRRLFAGTEPRIGKSLTLVDP